MITVKSIKKDSIWDLVTRDAELDAYANSPEVQKAKAAIADVMAAKKCTSVDGHYMKTLRKQAVACVKDALFEPHAPVLKNDVMTLCIYALDCGLVTPDPASISYCVKPPISLEHSPSKGWAELGMRLLYALGQKGVRISVSFTFPDTLDSDECSLLDRFSGFNELVNAIVDAVLEWEIGRTGEIWNYWGERNA